MQDLLLITRKDIEKMFVSKSITALRAQEIANLNKAQDRCTLILNLLDLLPAGTPDPQSVYDFGYCAQATLNFKNEGNLVHALLKLYPPIECIDLVNGPQSQKPAKCLRKEELGGSIQPIYPVILKESGGETSARWWTVLGDFDTEINVSNTPISEISGHLAQTHDAQCHQYSTGSATYFTRKLAEPKTRKASESLWALDWFQFGETRGLNAKQMAFWKSLLSCARTGNFEVNTELSLSEFFDERWARRDVEGECTLVELFPNEALRAQLSAFVLQQVKLLPVAKAKTDEEFATVKAWFEDFFTSHGCLGQNDWNVAKLIGIKLRKDTQLDVQVRMMNPTGARVSVSAYFKGVEQYPDWTFTSNADLPRIRPQDIEVDYM